MRADPDRVWVMFMFDLATWAPVLVTFGILFLNFELHDDCPRWNRAFAAAFCGGLTVRYMWWRATSTLPTQQNALQACWSGAFLLVELATLTSTLLVYFFMSRTVDRSGEATAYENSADHDLPADVFIATYNESQDILERTMVGALAIDHPDLRVWLLDDGNRTWARELAESLGVRYVSRVKGKHAKAGNINNGLREALASDRVPRFFLILDADFVPHRSILQRALGLFHDPTVGIVQTPQHFFNPDPIQANLLCSAVWPDEQRFFFNCLLPSKDAWGAAFCCGTSAVFRTEAFVRAQGMAVETVTEDMLTTFKFQEWGYRTIFLNERLSLGLAPESLVDFISQRARWCLGAVQQIFTRWSFAGSGRVSLINRIAFFDTVLYWVSGATFKLMIVVAPLLYWFTGTSAMHANTADLIQQLAPMLLANLLFMFYLTENRILPIMTDVTQLLTAIVIVRTVITGFIRPFGRAFKVTAKGLSSSQVTVQWKFLWPYALTGVATLAGVLFHTARFSPAHGTQGYSANIFWSLANVALLALATLACVEPPHRRRDERFLTSENATLRLTGFAQEGEDAPLSTPVDLSCQIRDLSLGGASLVAAKDWQGLIGPAQLQVYSEADKGLLSLPVDVLSRSGQTVRVRFHDVPWIRHALIRKLFTGEYHRDVEGVKGRAVLTTLARTLFS